LKRGASEREAVRVRMRIAEFGISAGYEKEITPSEVVAGVSNGEQVNSNAPELWNKMTGKSVLSTSCLKHP
jgi:hypothetical protein